MGRASSLPLFLALALATGCADDREASTPGADDSVRGVQAQVDLAAATGSADPLALLDELAAQRPGTGRGGRDPFSRHARPTRTTPSPTSGNPTGDSTVEPLATRPPRLIGISRLGGDAVAVFDSGSAGLNQRVGRWTVRAIDGNRVVVDDGSSVLTLEL